MIQLDDVLEEIEGIIHLRWYYNRAKGKVKKKKKTRIVGITLIINDSGYRGVIYAVVIYFPL